MFKIIDRIPQCYKELCSSNQNLNRVFHRTWQVDSIRTKIFLNGVGRITQSDITSFYKATVSNLKVKFWHGEPNKTEWKQTIRPENLWKNHPVRLPSWASQVALVVKNLPANAGNKRDAGLIPGLRRSPGEGNGTPLQYSCLENPMDRGVWWATVHGVTRHDLGDLAPCTGHHEQCFLHLWIQELDTLHKESWIPAGLVIPIPRDHI